MQITVIGGAGVRTVIFINGLLERYKQLDIDTVVLYDIDQQKQEYIGKLCQHVINKSGVQLILKTAKTPEESLVGADYVVTTLRVGGDHSRVIDETIALKHGVIGQETTGVGGFSMAARTIPVLLKYCKLIKENAPNAWIFNFTNPSGMVTQALRKAGYKKVIGICDAPSSTKHRMASYLNIPEEQLYVEFFGLNHLSWIRSVKFQGKELLCELLKDYKFLDSIQEFAMFDKSLLEYLKCLPNEYLYYYYHREKAMENIVKSGSTRGKLIESVNEQMMQDLSQINIDENPEQALQIFLYYMEKREESYMSIETNRDTQSQNQPQIGGREVPDGMGYAGVMLDCIEGLRSDEGKYLVLSVDNQGCLPYLQDDDVIEVTCNVSKNGIKPVIIDEQEDARTILIRQLKHYEKKSIQAITTNNIELAIEALMVHPLINSYSIAKDLLEEYQNTYQNFLKEQL